MSLLPRNPLFIPAFCLLALLSACNDDEKKAALPPPVVTVLEVHKADIPLTYEYPGRIAGSREVEIRARVSGILKKRRYTEGQWVKEGTVLFEIDPAPYEASLAEARARFSQAQKDWERVKNLKQQDAISAREFEQAQSAYEQANAAIKTARINLGYTTVTAPISGVTSYEGLSEGSLVEDQTSLLTRISQLDPMYVYFSAPEMEALSQRQQVAEGIFSLPEDKQLKADIRFNGGGTYPHEGKIDFTDSIITPETGSVRVRAVFPNPDGSLLPGQFVRINVKGFTRLSAFSVPDQAIMQGPQGPYVYTVDSESKAVSTPVTLGELNKSTRIITSGLQDGDKVITEGMIKATPNSPVTIADPASEKAATNTSSRAP